MTSAVTSAAAFRQNSTGLAAGPRAPRSAPDAGARAPRAPTGFRPAPSRAAGRGASAVAQAAEAPPAGGHTESQRASGPASTSGSAALRAAELLQSFFAAQREQYLRRNPTARRCLSLLQAWQGGPGGAAPPATDHLAFRTFGVHGCGINSVAAFLEDFGYTRRDSLSFPQKKLRAFWFAPPRSHLALPRVFVSELAVEELSPTTQEIIGRYAASVSSRVKHAFEMSLVDPVPWPTPSSPDFAALARESEYAAWTLVNGYSLNHTTLSVHHMASLDSLAGGADPASPIHRLNSVLASQGIKLNEQGGLVKASPDGLLLQSSTVADSAPFQFSDGVVLDVPLSYMEFALRLVLPEYAHVPESEIQEHHRRDGFEASNADKIFESTSSTQ